MKTNKVLTTGLGIMVALTGAFGLTACGSDSGDGGGTSQNQAASESDIAEDLENARTAVADALAEDDSWNQIMLASDVTAPTVKYGLLVVPYSFSEAASRIQGTVNISDGKFTIDGDSAETGTTWQIDQDGVITEVAD
ncbi:hypothetical protein [Cellulomonas denverensis]|uniref:Lipoprotein n=1 Tax=Cellulomonas denverensis TaxID=264297 RepID=A0A7X6KWZ8_9CELL|nr:hypothetical protein [Cellulomonas denverensis]NKY23774.1 hypothetical protein [Cellulomonas denverensis]GIG25733.1 hypothetical protein Cde04nite_19770 [Cellulomonas denverensis]